MIVTFFEVTEEMGIGNMTVHRQLQEGKFVNKMVFETKIPFKRGVQPNFIQVNTYSNMSVWALKQLIAKHTDQSPLNITIKRADTKKPDIKDSKNCKILSDLNFTEDEMLQITRTKVPDPCPVPLIDKEGNLVPELETIVKEWFHTFSKDLTKEEVIEISKESPLNEPLDTD